MSRGHDPRDFFLAMYGTHATTELQLASQEITQPAFEATTQPAIQTMMPELSSRQRSPVPAPLRNSAVPLEREPRPYSGVISTNSRSAVLALPASSRPHPDSPGGQLVRAKKPSTSTAVTASPSTPARNTLPLPQTGSGPSENADHCKSGKAPPPRKATPQGTAARSRANGSEAAKGASSTCGDSPKPFPLDTSSPYEVLDIRETATAEEIRKAYKRAALNWHPDLCMGNAEEKALATRRFQLVAEAFAVLGDREWDPFLKWQRWQLN